MRNWMFTCIFLMGFKEEQFITCSWKENIDGKTVLRDVNICRHLVGSGCPGPTENGTDFGAEGMSYIECCAAVEVTSM
jgi:hypothetical protein